VASWSIVPSPNRAGFADNQLNGVSCSASTECVAVGFSRNESSTEVPLAEFISEGEWHLSTPPLPAGASFGVLQSVSCWSAAACTAVGWYSHSGEGLTLAERWNGSEWSIQATENPSGGSSLTMLESVSCPSAKACMAVGTQWVGSERLTVAERWNGKSWTLVPTISPGSFAELRAVSCRSATVCTAAGTDLVSTVAERWNGMEWTLQESANSEAAFNALNGVACGSAKSCIAVGNSAKSLSGPFSSLAEGWNGTTWALQTPAGGAGEASSSLQAVSCVTAKACTAVGRYTTTEGATLTLANSWNGTGWALETTPNPVGVTHSELGGEVSCVTATECVAVGSYQSGGNLLTLIERKP
jgi:hypothetical protein